ncbi:hypothetical protein GGTG_01956 [Gaeumannomyces tritici R3-111a-1]|uniref:Rhodopsin domain-containing protein n=1 Tax=Gaeumannomyces tritici (strain R3-111a-1) TaxID=644352 RepID=J3NL15_GAET3|nr:hypothetical protein GGTG_01956 [Gaeumannomyces tritici R3-111a-1]EJT81982.1 hypothetical protein GGTG_01956 [Gaeumannomyces tritici R3-111a-1]
MRIPLAAVAAWPPANHVNPETLGPGNTILLSILQTLVTALIAIRLYTRMRMSTGCRLDDTLIVLAYVPTTGYAIGGIYQELVLKGDRHIWDFPIENSEAAFKLSLAHLLLFCGATTLTKLSMLALIHRITTAAGDRTGRMLTGALAAVVALDGVVFLVVELTQCRPLSLYWTPSIRRQDCINESAHLLAAGVINTVTDLLIVLLPVRTVLNLDLPRRQLLVVQALLGGGILATVAGAVRTKYTWSVFTAPDFDVTWRLHLVISLSAVELYLGIVCASLAATKPFFQHFIPRLLGRSDVTEPLSLKKSRPSVDDGGSMAALRSSARSMANGTAIPKPAWLSKMRRGGGDKGGSGGGGNLAAQLQFGWRPIISSPVISSPITPLVKDKNQKLQGLQRQQSSYSIARKPVPGSTPPWQYPEARLVPISSFSTATPRPATAVPSTSHARADLNKPLPALDAAAAASVYSSPGFRGSAVVEALSLLTTPAPASASRSRPLTTYGAAGFGPLAAVQQREQQRPPRRSSAPRMPSSSLAYEPSVLAGSSSSTSGGGGTQSQMCSVYDFMAYDDGHISVYKASGGGGGGGGGRTGAPPSARD